MNQQIKRLYRSRDEAQVAGVCAGLGLYIGIDPVVVRLISVALTLVTGVVPGVLAYLAAWLIVPLAPQPVVVVPAQEQSQEGSA